MRRRRPEKQAQITIGSREKDQTDAVFFGKIDPIFRAQIFSRVYTA